MEYREFTFTLRPQGIYIEAGYLRFVMGYFEQGAVQYDTAVRWCREQGGMLPTLEQALVLCEYRQQLNDALRTAGQREIGDHLLTRRKHPISQEAVYVVSMHSGNIDRSSKKYYNPVRCIIPITT